MPTGVQAGARPAASRMGALASILKLLGKGVLVIIVVLGRPSLLTEPPCLLEMLLLFSQREDGLIHLQGAGGEGVVALPHQLLASFVVAVDVEILFGDHVDEILQGIFVHSNGCGVEAMDFQHVALRILDLKDIDSMMFSVQACVGGSQRHELVQQWRLL